MSIDRNSLRLLDFSISAGVAQMVRAPDCGSGGPRFDPGRQYQPFRARKGFRSPPPPVIPFGGPTSLVNPRFRDILMPSMRADRAGRGRREIHRRQIHRREIHRALLALFICHAAAHAQGGGWRPIFNGKDLSGWEIVGAGDWKADDGQLVLRRKPGERGAGWLVSRDDFSDFKLRLKFKSKLEHFNSGILLRDPGHAKRFRPAFNGYEIQIQQGTKEGT